MTFLPENIFAKIITGEIPCDKVWENERILAFKDINPQAKIHILTIPKTDIKTAKEISQENLPLFGELFLAAKEIAEKLNLDGYKLHMNVDEAGGQIVPHLHLHLLSPDSKINL